ncbi:hypothetical protein BKA69DRAFT_235229 [Paraphysoderma sedebokerense]|nr:hypothetical protein BKA69DRAFT_235229 [Paraphysoderma sedebokerense]
MNYPTHPEKDASTALEESLMNFSTMTSSLNLDLSQMHFHPHDSSASYLTTPEVYSSAPVSAADSSIPNYVLVGSPSNSTAQLSNIAPRANYSSSSSASPQLSNVSPSLSQATMLMGNTISSDQMASYSPGLLPQNSFAHTSEIGSNRQHQSHRPLHTGYKQRRTSPYSIPSYPNIAHSQQLNQFPSMSLPQLSPDMSHLSSPPLTPPTAPNQLPSNYPAVQSRLAVDMLQSSIPSLHNNQQQFSQNIPYSMNQSNQYPVSQQQLNHAVLSINQSHLTQAIPISHSQSLMNYSNLYSSMSHHAMQPQTNRIESISVSSSPPISSSSSSNVSKKSCQCCGSKTTPKGTWRSGWSTSVVLCNSCGLRWK